MSHIKAIHRASVDGERIEYSPHNERVKHFVLGKVQDAYRDGLLVASDLSGWDPYNKLLTPATELVEPGFVYEPWWGDWLAEVE